MYIKNIHFTQKYEKLPCDNVSLEQSFSAQYTNILIYSFNTNTKMHTDRHTILS